MRAIKVFVVHDDRDDTYAVSVRYRGQDDRIRTAFYKAVNREAAEDLARIIPSENIPPEAA